MSSVMLMLMTLQIGIGTQGTWKYIYCSNLVAFAYIILSRTNYNIGTVILNCTILI